MKATSLPDPAALHIAPIGEHPEYNALIVERAALEKRAAESEARRARAVAQRRGVKAARSPVEMAKDLVKGAFVPGLDPDLEIAAASQELHEILAPALRELAERIADNKGDLSLAQCERVQPAYSGALRALYSALEDALAAFRVLVEIKARLRERGYEALSGPLPDYVPQAIYSLLVDGPRSYRWCRAQLEHCGVL
jgi:class 3 adenylate cyclase